MLACGISSLYYETLFLPNTVLRIAMSEVIVTTLLISPTSMLPDKLTLPLAIAYVTTATANNVSVSARKVIKNPCVLDFARIPLGGWSLTERRD